MAFRLKRAVALKICADQVEAAIARPIFRNKVWEDGELHSYLTDIGFDYTEEEVNLLNDELHNRGIVEDVPEE